MADFKKRMFRRNLGQAAAWKWGSEFDKVFLFYGKSCFLYIFASILISSSKLNN